jgi:hydrogenase expression/formation protein HypC
MSESERPERALRDSTAQGGGLPWPGSEETSVLLRFWRLLSHFGPIDMCVAIPVKIKSIDGPMADVEIGGVVRRVSLRLTPEAKEDDYVLVHAGFAIHIIDEQEAQETVKLFEQLEATEGS